MFSMSSYLEGIYPRESQYSQYYPINDSSVSIRKRYFAGAILNPVVGVADIALGILLASCSLLTFGAFKQLNQQAFHSTLQGGLSIASSLKGVIKFLNPHASFKINNPSQEGITVFAAKKLQKWAEELSDSKNLCLKHGLSRLAYFGSTLLSIATRITDLAIGLLAAPIALVTFGTFEKVNSLAFKGLLAPLIFKDIYFCMLKTLNPWAPI